MEQLRANSRNNLKKKANLERASKHTRGRRGIKGQKKMCVCYKKEGNQRAEKDVCLLQKTAAQGIVYFK